MLSDTERAMLDFEKITFRYLGSKEDQIRQRFDISATAYFQRLNALLDRPKARAYAPSTVKRLLRLRDTRRTPRRLTAFPT